MSRSSLLSSSDASPVKPGPGRSGGRLWRYVVLLVFLGFFSLTAATIAGVAPGLSTLAGTARSRDLGVRHDAADLDSALSKLTVRQGRLEATLSEEELSAYLSHVLAGSDLPVRELQLRLRPGNRFEAAGMARYEGREYPVYLQGTAELRGQQMDSALDKARVAGLPLPSRQRGEIEEAIEEELAAWLESEGDTRLAVLQTGDGSIQIAGGPG